MLLELAPKHGWACGGQDRRVLGKLLRPKSNADIEDRQNELRGNLSLNKELDFILTINKWRDDPRYSSRYGEFAKDHKHVTVRTIKMEEKTADKLRYSSKFNRSHDFMDQMRKEGHVVARDWLDRWPEKARCYPEDGAYRKVQTTGPKPRLPKTKGGRKNGERYRHS